MATKKITKKTSTKTEKVESEARTSSPMDYFKFGESYTSLILGIVVVIIASILLISFVRNRDGIDLPSGDTPDISSTEIGPDAQENNEGEYTVQEGDDLWSIAESETGSGYNWVAIQNANNISNPNDIEAGSTLIIPEIENVSEDSMSESSVTPTPTVTVESEQTEVASDEDRPAITGTTHTVSEGDTLWSIAERRYNDGYQFVRIAQANGIVNPNWILVGQKLSLPEIE